MKREGPFSDALMSEIRKRFANVESDPFSGERIYFENAGGTLKLKSLFDVIELCTALPDNAGRENPASKKVDELIARGRADVALFLGAESGTIIAEQSTTGMICRLLNAIASDRRRGNLVTTNLDHASAYDATHLIAERFGMEARIAGLDPETGTVPVEALIEQVDQDTAAVIVIHASNIFGTRNDVAAIVREVRHAAPDACVILDGAQHASHGKIDVEEYNADAYVFAPYKTYSKIGVVFAHVSDRLARLPHDRLRGNAEDHWDLGTREVAAYACMSKVVEYLQWLGGHFTERQDGREKVLEGTLAIERHELALTRALLHGTDRARGMLDHEAVTVYGGKDDLSRQECIIAFNVAGKGTVDVVDYFARGGVRLHNRTCNAYSRYTLQAMAIEECVRVSLCHYNTLDEVSTFLKLLATLAGDQGS